jgi:TonB family protein
VLPGWAKAGDAAKVGDAEGCVDLKPLPRLDGCVIVECSAKQHDPFDSVGGSGAPAEANINALAYTCPAGDLEKRRRDFEAQVRKAGYQNIVQEKSDTAGISLTARKGSQWIRWGANAEDGAFAYSLTVANAGSEKFKAETCGLPPVFSQLKQCEVMECASKSEDSVAMRTAPKEETSLTGNVQSVTLACPAVNAVQTFSAVEGELKGAGFDILFSDREHPESAWMTGRAGNRWVELVSASDAAESVSFSLTVVPSAEVLTAAKAEPVPVVAATPAPAPASISLRDPVPAAVETVAQVDPPQVAPALPDTPRSAPAATPAAAPVVTGFVAPKPILQVPIEATHDRFYSVSGEVVINMLVDINEQGAVTKAELSGHITKDVLRLESAALDAVWRWRFEPARQDGHVVPAVKIPVQMRFHGRPWRL